MARVLLAAVALVVAAAAALVRGEEDGNMILVDPKKLEMFVDELPSMPKLDGFRVDGAKLLPASLTVGMFQKTWRTKSSRKKKLSGLAVAGIKDHGMEIVEIGEALEMRMKAMCWVEEET